MGQTSVSTLSEQASVDGLDKASIANSDGPAPGSQTPPFKRKGKLSTIGKIFKPWKWRKKKTSDKFRETSAVLERKISTRQSREELIRRGVLKEMPEPDGDVTVNFETSNGHTIAIGEEIVQEENVVKSPEDNGSISEKIPTLEGQKEDKKESTDKYPETPASYAPPPPKSKPKAKKAPIPPKNVTAASTTTSRKNNEASHVKKKVKAPTKQPPAPPPKPTSHSANREAASSSHGKKIQASKLSSSPAPSSTSSHPKASKETISSKTGTSGTAKGKKKPTKQSGPRTGPDGAVSSTSNVAVNNLETKVENSVPKQLSFIISEAEDTDQQIKLIVPPPPTTAPPPPPSLPTLASQSTVSSDMQDIPVSPSTGLSVPGSDANHLLQTECETENENVSRTALDNSLHVSEDAQSSVTQEDQKEETPNLASAEPPEEPSENVAPPESDSSKENHTSDSDSDGPILYTDDDDDDDDNASAESSLASKIRRRDTLAIKLGNRPSKKELEDKNILQRTSEEERQEIRHQIGTKLVRRLSQRPTTEELEQRNILKQKNEEEEQEARRELKRRLSRKAAIRKELNEFKSTEMEVHEESRQFTRFHRP
uniref:Phosphatase and actin regulator n=1 Tax=Crocodylus porosus TaxID=8502 RepID=A0A7M4DXG5_CROPO